MRGYIGRSYISDQERPEREMYYFVVAIGLFGLCYTTANTRDPLDPRILLTVMLFGMFFSDFAVKGYTDTELDGIPSTQVWIYQIIILAIVSQLWLYAISRRVLVRRRLALSSLSPRSTAALTAIGSTILIAEILKRLLYTKWSFLEMVELSFGPRFGRPWDQAGSFGGNNYLESLIGILAPFAGFAAAVALICGKVRILRVVALCSWLISVALAVGNGSRTIAIVILMMPALMQIGAAHTRKEKFRAVLTTLLFLTVGAYISSIIYRGRDVGIGNNAYAVEALSYHQDNSYYLALKAAYIATTTDERWDALTFLGASTLNFIPRAIWPGKPTVSYDFWGSYKEFFVTNTFVGESFAMFGAPAGSVFAILVGCLLVNLLTWMYRRIRGPSEMLQYLVVALYVYMVMRSMLNITQFIYLPLCAIAVAALLRRMPRKLRRV